MTDHSVSRRSTITPPPRPEKPDGSSTKEEEIPMVSRLIPPLADIERANKATAARFVRAFNHDGWDAVREVVADRFVYHPIGGTVEAGPEGMVATWAGFKRLSPDSWHPIPNLIAEGDHVAVYTGVSMYRIEDDRIAERQLAPPDRRRTPPLNGRPGGRGYPCLHGAGVNRKRPMIIGANPERGAET